MYNATELKKLLPHGDGAGLMLGGQPTRELDVIDPHDLRFALLFWDRLVWPYNDGGMHSFDRSPEELFLVECKILHRPEYCFIGEIGADSREAYTHAFESLERAEPGKWSIDDRASRYISSYLRGQTTTRQTIDFELWKALPVPDIDVPLHEILEFKRHRADELAALRSEIDSLSFKIFSESSSTHAIQYALSQIDGACSQVLAASRDWKYRMRLSDFSCSFDFKPVDAAKDALLAYGAAHLAGLNAAAAAASIAIGAAASFKLSAKITLPTLAARAGAYRYVASMNREIS